MPGAPPRPVVPPALTLGAPPLPGAPPVPAGGVQLAGRSATVLPGQSSHSPQVLPHWVFFTQRGQALVSSRFASEQDAASAMSTVLPSGLSTVQQPKQSQPFWVSGAQNFTQASVSLQSESVAGKSPVRQPVA